VAGGFDVVLVDSRDFWVYHRQGMEFVEKAEAESGARPNPHNYSDLIVGDRQLQTGGVNLHAPWKAEPGDFWQGEYVDPIEMVAGGRGRRAFACATRLQPYASADSAAGSQDNREWTLVVQMDQEAALRPVADLRTSMFLAGALLVVALSALAIVLWIWLFRLLRGWEFAAHG
jgi:hypothetical protein